MARRRERYEVRVGFLILFALVTLAATVIFLGRQRGFLRPRYHLRTLMERVNGLQEGAPVRLAGVDVGTVTQVEFSSDLDNPRIEVTMEIDYTAKKYIRKDSRAHIGTLGLLGDKFIGITMGSSDQPELEDWDYIQSTSPVDVEKLIDEGVDVFNTLRKSSQKFHDLTLYANRIASKIDRGEGTLGLLVNDPRMYFDLSKLVAMVAALTSDVESGTGTAALLLRDPQLYWNLNNLLRSSTLLADSLRAGSGTAGRFVQDPTLYEGATRLLASVDSLTRSLNELVAKLQNERGTIARLSRDDSLYVRLVKAITSLDSLATDLRKNPKRYINVRIF